MARRTHVTLVDDVDGSAATSTVTFSLDGVSYEIDLSDENAEKMREEIGEWAAKARRVGGRKAAGARRPSADNDAAKIREWAKENGYTVSARGRVSSEVREAYTAAH
ncbi:Lsr2 family protein [Brachybacterium paraconglomeratum]